MAGTFNGSRYHALMFRTAARLSSSSDFPLLSDITFQQVILFVIDRGRLLRTKLADSRSPGITPPTRSPRRSIVFILIFVIIVFRQRNYSSTDLRY